LAQTARLRSSREIRASLQVIGAGRSGRQQQKDQIDWLAVDRLEIERLLEPCEEGHRALQPRDAAMRHGGAVADAGAAELLALP